MQVDLPDQLKGLPPPWFLTESEVLGRELELMPRSTENLLMALEVLERAMLAKVQLSCTRSIKLAEEINNGFFMSELDRRIGRLDCYDREILDDLFEGGAGRKGSRTEVDDLAAMWLSGAVFIVVQAAMDWLLPSLRENPDSALAQAYRRLVRDRWKHVRERHASSLISYLALVRCPETEELLQEIDNDHDVTPDLKRAVMGVRSNWKEQDYYKANPHLLKW